MPNSILQRIGDTSLLELRRIVPQDCARIFVKLESENPTGSMKDRMALAMIEAAEASGRLRPGGRVVDYTGGSTGVSLALVCAARGYRLSLVTAAAFSAEKRAHMAALGAEVSLVPSTDGGMDEGLTRRMIAAAGEIATRRNACWTDQLNNADQLPAYHRMAEEIWTQSNGGISAFVQATGTAASLRGIAEGLRRHKPDVLIVAVEPAESAVLSGGPSGVHRIEGIGAGFVVPLWKADLVDEIACVSTDEAMAMARRLALSEALFAGTSTGANLVAAIAVGRRLGPEARIVTVACDSGIKYLSTALYAEESRVYSKPRVGGSAKDEALHYQTDN
ncbi:MAG: cysteine synthase A [Rhodospirillales bacterium]